MTPSAVPRGRMGALGAVTPESGTDHFPSHQLLKLRPRVPESPTTALPTDASFFPTNKATHRQGILLPYSLSQLSCFSPEFPHRSLWLPFLSSQRSQNLSRTTVTRKATLQKGRKSHHIAVPSICLSLGSGLPGKADQRSPEKCRPHESPNDLLLRHLAD